MIVQEIEVACVTGNFGTLGNFKSNNINIPLLPLIEFRQVDNEKE